VLIADSGVFHDLGIACIIAALLGGSIDPYLRQGLTRDAFEGAMGYFLPDDIKEAVRYMGGIDWFAEEFSLTVKLEKIDNDTIKCTIRTRKYLRNISNGTKSIKSNIHVDEWNHSEQKSHIVSCEAKTSSVTKHLNPESVRMFDSTVYGETELVNVHSREAIELLAEAVEFKSLNDDLHYALGYMARSPEIYVEPLQGFEIRAGISADAKIQKHAHMPLYKLPRFYLPWQRMMVRWWPANGDGVSLDIAVENVRQQG
jgi:hypothetical protein